MNMKWLFTGSLHSHNRGKSVTGIKRLVATTKDGLWKPISNHFWRLVGLKSHVGTGYYCTYSEPLLLQIVKHFCCSSRLFRCLLLLSNTLYARVLISNDFATEILCAKCRCKIKNVGLLACFAKNGMKVFRYTIDNFCHT